MRDGSIATVRPQDVQVSQDALQLLNQNLAERFRVCPVAFAEGRTGKTITVATTEPQNLMIFDQLQQLTGCRIVPVKATAEDIERGIEKHYKGVSSYTEAPTDLLSQYGVADDVVASEEQTPAPSASAPIAQAGEVRTGTGTVEKIIAKAIAERASDIHIEPHAESVLVRFRIDGLMYDQTSYDPNAHAQVISRIKILSHMDIAQNRMPQDGRFPIKIGTKEFDIRVSVVPSTCGEKAVMRLFAKSPLAMDFAQLGLDGPNRQTLEELLARPFGMVLATGPTGSGKTTTLYSCLAKVDCVGKNVVTVEDPVEYQFGRVTQMQVHPKIGFTFALGLRAILRQDPDVIMVGEIRDLETLEMAVQSALTGHMVLSTLHCNDAAAGAARMIDMGAEPFLIASSINGIIAQRLVRKVCEQCKQPTPVTDLIRQKLELPNDDTVYYSGRGCQACRNTGFMGRISVYEVIPFIEPMQQAVVRKASAGEIRGIIRDLKLPTLRDDGLRKVRAGITSLEEVMRAVAIASV